MGIFRKQKEKPAVKSGQSNMTQRQPMGSSVNPALADIKYIIAIASGKGGVGKSTVASNLALALKATGSTVGLMDADIYGPSQPGMLGAETKQPDVSEGQLQPVNRHGVKFISMGLLLDDESPVIWRAPMAMKMIQQFISAVNWGKLDFLLIDLPPGTGDVQLTLAQQASLTAALIVTTPQDVAVGVARKGLRMFETVKVPIAGIIENMSGFKCAHCGEVTAIFKEGGGEKMAREFGVTYLGAIPLDPQVMAGGEEGIPVVIRNADAPAAIAFVKIAEGLQKELEKMAGGSTELKPLEINLMLDRELHISWADGHQSRHQPYNLRTKCPCANCIDEDSGKTILDKRTVPLDISIRTVNNVGRYALAFEYSDHHSTGIYSYELLRDLCECAECLKKIGSGSEAFNV